jgi:hypothetical protein
LILLAQRVEDRRVYEGELGCPNCRDNYPVRAGFADIRLPPRDSGPETKGPERQGTEEGDAGGEAAALRIAAALGVTEGPGTLLLVGPSAQRSGDVSNLVGGVEVVGIHPALAGVEEQEGVSRMQSGPALPFFSASFRGVLLSGTVQKLLLEEGFRVAAPGGRVVVFEPGEEDRTWVKESGHTILLDEDGVLIAEREGVENQPLVTLRGL